MVITGGSCTKTGIDATVCATEERAVSDLSGDLVIKTQFIKQNCSKFLML